MPILVKGQKAKVLSRLRLTRMYLENNIMEMKDPVKFLEGLIKLVESIDEAK